MTSHSDQCTGRHGSQMECGVVSELRLLLQVAVTAIRTQHDPPTDWLERAQAAASGVETTNEYPTDRAGWICSVCHGWNHVQHKFCTHTHAVGPEVKAAAPLAAPIPWVCEDTARGVRCGRSNHPDNETCWYCRAGRPAEKTTPNTSTGE